MADLHYDDILNKNPYKVRRFSITEEKTDDDNQDIIINY